MWTDQHQDLLERFARKFPPPIEDEPCRSWTVKLAEQFAHTFPSQAWGTKRADPGRPPSTDCICTQSPFVGYDVIITQGRPEQHLARHPEALNLTGQVFIPVVATDHVGGAVKPPKPKPPKPEPAKPVPVYPDESTFWKEFQDKVRAAYRDKGRVFPDPHDVDSFRPFSRCGFDIGAGMAPQQAADKHIAELRAALGL